MLKVESFLKIENDFISILEFNKTLPDDFYIEGAIEIVKGNKKILSVKDWDYIDQLWGYFLDGIEYTIKGLDFKTRLPDQPTAISFIYKSNLNKVIITVDRRKSQSICVDYDEFLIVFIEEGTKFFKKMNSLLPSEYNYELNKLSSLKELYQKNKTNK